MSNVKHEKSRKYYFEKHHTLCWKCKNATGKCSWSDKFIPVDGWNAVPTKLLIGSSIVNGVIKKHYSDSFYVYECPEFELLEILKK